jgi:hypothetical protein
MAAVGACGRAADAQQPIAANEHFAGRERHEHVGPRPTRARPVWAGRTGPVAGGQTLSVVRARRGHGYTGPFAQIYAWFVPQKSTTSAPANEVHLLQRAPGNPHSVQVPCDGNGQVEFSSCPTARCAFGTVPTTSPQFVNIAV